MRPRLRTNCWLCIVTSLSLALSGVSSPIRTSQIPNARFSANHLSLDFVLVPHGFGLAITSATPGRVTVDADSSDFDEEDEYESFWSISHPVCRTFVSSVSPPKLLSRPRPGTSPPRTDAIPLRC